MEELLRWENLVFLLPLIGTVCYLILFASGLGGGKDIDTDHDLDHHIDHDHDFEHGGILYNLLSVLGIGRVPVSIVFMSMGFIWGFGGYACNRLYGNVSLSLAVACLSALVGTSLISLIVGKLMPKVQSFAVTNQQLVGQVGLVLNEVTPTSGTVRVRDTHGSILDIPARVRTGESNVPKDTRVCLTQFDSAQCAFLISRA